MSDVTIVTDDARKLVAEGGVVNRDEPLPDGLPQWWRHVGGQRTRSPHPPSNLGPCSGCETDGVAPFTAEVRGPCGRCAFGDKCECRFGTVRVVDVHHASECETFVQNMDDPLGIVLHCHDDAEPNRWHLVVEPIDRGDDDE